MIMEMKQVEVCGERKAWLLLILTLFKENPLSLSLLYLRADRVYVELNRTFFKRINVVDLR